MGVRQLLSGCPPDLQFFRFLRSGLCCVIDCRAGQAAVWQDMRNSATGFGDLEAQVTWPRVQAAGFVEVGQGEEVDMI